MISEATCASALTRTGPNTVPMKVIKHWKHTLAWQYEIYVSAEKPKLCWSVDCGCQNSQGKMCVNKNANISLAVRDICLTITHHPPQSFVIEIVYWPISSAVCRQRGTGWRATAQVLGSCRPHGVVLNVRGVRHPSAHAGACLAASHLSQDALNILF